MSAPYVRCSLVLVLCLIELPCWLVSAYSISSVTVSNTNSDYVHLCDVSGLTLTNCVSYPPPLLTTVKLTWTGSQANCVLTLADTTVCTSTSPTKSSTHYSCTLATYNGGSTGPFTLNITNTGSCTSFSGSTLSVTYAPQVTSSTMTISAPQCIPDSNDPGTFYGCPGGLAAPSWSISITSSASLYFSSASQTPSWYMYMYAGSLTSVFCASTGSYVTSATSLQCVFNTASTPTDTNMFGSTYGFYIITRNANITVPAGTTDGFVLSRLDYDWDQVGPGLSNDAAGVGDPNITSVTFSGCSSGSGTATLTGCTATPGGTITFSGNNFGAIGFLGFPVIILHSILVQTSGQYNGALGTVCSSGLNITDAFTATCTYAGMSTSTCGGTCTIVGVGMAGVPQVAPAVTVTMTGGQPTPVVTGLIISTTGSTSCSCSSNACVNCPYNGAAYGSSSVMTVTLTGTNFVTGTCSFSNGGSCSATPTQVTCTFTGGTVGTTYSSANSNIYLTFTSVSPNIGATFSAGSITIASIPTITGLTQPSSCSSTSGSSGACAGCVNAVSSCLSSGGGTLSVYGTNFYGTLIITQQDGSTSLCSNTPTIVSSTSAYCSLGSGSAGQTFDVLVASAGGISASQTTYTVNYLGVPTISSLIINSTSASALVCSGTGGTAASYTLCPFNGKDSLSSPANVYVTGTNFISGCSCTVCTGCTTYGTTFLACQLMSVTSSASTQVFNSLTVTCGTQTSSALASSSVSYAPLPVVTGLIAPSSCYTTSGTGTQSGSVATVSNCLIAGSGTLTVYGTSFYSTMNIYQQGTTTSLCNGPPAIDVSNNFATCPLVAGSSGAGPYSVQVVSNGGTATTQASYTIQYMNVPTVTGLVSPSTCYVTSGTGSGGGVQTVSACSVGGTGTLSVYGSNFYSTVSIYQQGTTTSLCSGAPTISSPTLAYCTLAAGTAGSGPYNVQAVSGGGTSATQSTFTVAYAAQPTVTGLVAPSSCTITSGTGSGGGVQTVSSCSSSGGGTLTVYGTNFYGTVAIQQQGTSTSLCSDSPVIISSTSATCTFASGTGGQTYNVQVQSAGGTSASQSTYTVSYTALPTVTGLVSPSSCYATSGTGSGGGVQTVSACSVSGGGTLSVYGTNFVSTISLYQQGTTTSLCSSSATIQSSTLATCTLAPGSAGAGPYNVQIVSGGGTSAVQSTYTISYASLPTVTGLVAPSSCTITSGTGSGGGVQTVSSCSSSGGGTLTVYGTNFYGTVAIQQQGTSTSLCSDSPVIISSTSARCTFASSTAGQTYNVQVQSAGGTSTTQSTYSVAYASSPTISQLQSTACDSGTTNTMLVNCSTSGTLTITGTNFAGTSSVSGCSSITSVSSTQIVCAWSGATAGGTQQISFTSSSGQFAASSNYQLSFAYVPQIGSVTASSGCTQASVTTLSGCALAAGSVTLTINGDYFYSGATVSTSVCSNTPTIISASQITCTLYSTSTVGTSFSGITVTSRGGQSSQTFSISYITNSFASTPTVSTAAFTTSSSLLLSVSPSSAGYVWIRVYPTGNSGKSISTTTSSTCSFATDSCLCNVVASHLTTTSQQDVTASCGTSLSNYSSVDVYAYIDNSATSTGSGTQVYLSSQTFCHSDCSTCSTANTVSACLSCPNSNYLSTSNTCCHSSCTTCQVIGSSASAPSSCLVCSAYSGNALCAGGSCGFSAGQKLRKSGSYSLNPTTWNLGLCCDPSCLTCNTAASNSGCASCPGRDGSPNSGTCKGKTNPGTVNFYAEIHGDPHFRGFLGQDYSITGVPNTVYNIITDNKLQYNARFIWYGDVYQGKDPTDNSTYLANVTYIGEVALKLRASLSGVEERMEFNAATGNFIWNEHEMPVSDAIIVSHEDPLISVQNAISISGKRTVTIRSPRFEFRFHLAGSKLKPFLNEEVMVANWDNLASHGLLGQTWQHLSTREHNRNEIWRDHIRHGILTDFMFAQADFLDGHLKDYSIDNDDMWGDDFKFDRYNH